MPDWLSVLLIVLCLFIGSFMLGVDYAEWRRRMEKKDE